MTALLYGAASLGIDSTPIEGFDEDKMDKLLNLDNYGVHSVLVVTLGYDAEDDHNRTRPLFNSQNTCKGGRRELILQSCPLT